MQILSKTLWQVRHGLTPTVAIATLSVNTLAVAVEYATVIVNILKKRCKFGVKSLCVTCNAYICKPIVNNFDKYDMVLTLTVAMPTLSVNMLAVMVCLNILKHVAITTSSQHVLAPMIVIATLSVTLSKIMFSCKALIVLVLTLTVAIATPSVNTLPSKDDRISDSYLK